MKSIFVLVIAAVCLITISCDAMPIKARTITGEFTRCLDGVCDKVYELFFEDNACFTSNNELGISFYIKKQKHAGRINKDYDILATNCTIDYAEENEGIDLYNFVNDKYDLVYLVFLLAAKITIGILAFFLFKRTKRIKSNYRFC